MSSERVIVSEYGNGNRMALEGYIRNLSGVEVVSTSRIPDGSCDACTATTTVVVLGPTYADSPLVADWVRAAHPNARIIAVSDHPVGTVRRHIEHLLRFDGELPGVLPAAVTGRVGA